MAEQKTTLRHVRANVYEDVKGGSEPLFVRTVERGEVQFGHQSGYGYLPESRVEIAGVTVAFAAYKRNTYTGAAENHPDFPHFAAGWAAATSAGNAERVALNRLLWLIDNEPPAEATHRVSWAENWRAAVTDARAADGVSGEVPRG